MNDLTRQPVYTFDPCSDARSFIEWVGEAMKWHTELRDSRAFWHGFQAMEKTCLTKDCPCIGGPWPKGQISGVLNGL